VKKKHCTHRNVTGRSTMGPFMPCSYYCDDCGVAVTVTLTMHEHGIACKARKKRKRRKRK